MDVSHILDPLNDAQRDAVARDPENILVLAGAGSGKTRVLVHRIAWYIQTGQAGVTDILAVTFTNKAANQMRTRIERLLKRNVGGMWVGTFHGIAHRLLRLHWQEARLPRNFQILDAEDQFRTIRRVIRALKFNDEEFPPRDAQYFINARKDEGWRARDLPGAGYGDHEHLLAIYRAYEETCERAGLVDFTELLLRAYELWQQAPHLLGHYQRRFRHLLVDEFQDTNAIQYAWLRQLTGNTGCLFAVGDDDQSIYSWRGARVENMQQFNRDFPNARLLRLEQNYRSTATILAAANALIANNAGRLGKELWTDGEHGENLSLYSAYNEVDEARFVVDRAADWQRRGGRYDEVAILYRVSAQSRVFEDVLRQGNIPYRVHGGFKFYERAEIKDTLAYLRLVNFRDDDAAFERIVNTPARGIGQRSLEELREVAKNYNISLWQAMLRVIEQRGLSARAIASLQQFAALIGKLHSAVASLSLHQCIETVIRHSGLLEHYQKDNSAQAIDRIENLEELVNAAQAFKLPDAEEVLDPLSEFLAYAALEGGEGQAKEYDDSVQLMTLHAAKGLEYPLVFLVGLEEGLFPHQRSKEDPSQLEEERRLCYVGLTRARRKLVLTHAEVRRLHGSEGYPKPSRFLREIPAPLIDQIRLSNASAPGRKAAAAAPHGDTGLKLGQRVVHTTFGEGVILNVEGRGSHTRVQVNFEQSGAKWLVAAYAGLQSV